jgi:flagellar basal-body rod modification protein FlgD
MTTTSSTSNTDYYQSLINSVNGTKTSSSSSSSSSSGSSMTAVQDQFLKLLTTQLQNQDPLNPMDNAQITSQIAQISTVTGIQSLNTTLQTLLAASQDSQTTQAASLVGQAVMVPGTSLQLASSTGSDGTTTTAAIGAYVLAGDADKVTVTIKDSDGNTVRTLTYGAQSSGLHDFTWDGITDSGTTAAVGAYKISVAAGNGSDSVTTTPLTLGSVRSVISNGSGFTLDVGSLGTFSIDDVKQIL